MATTRRKLTFASLGQVMPDVERLLAGHATAGRWSLGQILHHLALTVRLSVDGVPEKFPWPVRRLFGPVARRLSFWLGRIPRGVRVPDAYLPPPGPDAAREAEALRAAIGRFGGFAGRLDEHPLLGRLSRGQWERFHCLHCAHHLSFAVPAVPAVPAVRREGGPAGS